MGFAEGIVKFQIKKNLSKWAKGFGTTAVSILVPFLAEKAGLKLTEEQQAALAVAIGSAIVGFANALKTKYPDKFGWL